MHLTTPTSEAQGPGRVFRLAPEYRRCGVYIVLFCLLLAALEVGLKLAGLTPRTWAELFASPLTVMAGALLGVAVLTWRYALRVDDRGVWRRRFSRWDLWPWEAFAAGAVRTGTSKDSWVYPARPWHSRYLILEFLAEADRTALAERIRPVWRPAALPLPEEVEVRYGMGNRLALSRRGIMFRRRGSDQDRFYRLYEVVQLRVTRVNHTRRDFRTLELELPREAGPIRLRFQKFGRSWEGPDAEVVLAYLQQYVPANRVQVTALSGPPQDRDEADRRLADLDRADRQLRKDGWVALAALLTYCLLQTARILTSARRGPLSWDWFQWLAIGLLFLVIALLGLALGMARAERRRRLRALRSELTIWAAEQPGPARWAAPCHDLAPLGR
jgi:hypothetical protein